MSSATRKTVVKYNYIVIPHLMRDPENKEVDAGSSPA